MACISRSHLEQCFSAAALRAYFAEFLSTFLFVLIAVGSAVSARMLTPDATSDASALVATAVAQGFGLFAAVYVAADASGGHVNPAVTFGMTLSGHVSIPMAIFYWTSQMLGSTLACLLLRLASAGQAIPTTRIATEMTGFGGAVVEATITLALVYTVYVASDRRGGGAAKRGPSPVGPLAVGMVAGGCVLAAGSLTGASMNPARSFGPAVVSGDFKNQAVYWVGPFIGAAVAAFVHQNLVYPASAIDSRNNAGDASVV